jgi:hypothetical protein
VRRRCNIQGDNESLQFILFYEWTVAGNNRAGYAMISAVTFETSFQ